MVSNLDTVEFKHVLIFTSTIQCLIILPKNSILAVRFDWSTIIMNK